MTPLPSTIFESGLFEGFDLAMELTQPENKSLLACRAPVLQTTIEINCQLVILNSDSNTLKSCATYDQRVESVVNILQFRFPEVNSQLSICRLYPDRARRILPVRLACIIKQLRNIIGLKVAEPDVLKTLCGITCKDGIEMGHGHTSAVLADEVIRT